MCLFERQGINKKYIPNKKNKGIVPKLPILRIEKNGKIIYDERVKYITIKCTKCIECMKQKSRDWQIRLIEELRSSKNMKFIALTFSNESIKKLGKEVNKIKTITGCKKYIDKNGNERKRYIYKIEETINNIDGYERDNAIAKLGVRLFLERWRKKYDKSVKHWLVTELGHNGTENIHFHGFIWTNKNKEEIEKIWKYGYIWMNDEKKKEYMSEAAIHYCTKYIHKVDIQHKCYKPEILNSEKIGINYLNRYDSRKNNYKGKETNTTYRYRNGHETALPVYYRKKIIKENESEQLWIDSLNDGTKYIMGEKINSGDIKGYEVTLDYYRKLNNKLGYGNNEVDIDRKKYENEKRNTNYKRRTGIITEEKEKKDNNIPF